jgi:predicted RecB family nuclease
MVQLSNENIRIAKMPMLSKSRFIAGLQCPLRLWYQCYNSELATKPSPSKQALFDTGHEVGRLATSLYTGGVLIEEDYLHHVEAEKSTLKAMNNKNVAAIYEAAFTYNRIRIRVDILERHDVKSWNLVEVKSSTSVKDVYKPDLGVQYYILRGLGIDIVNAGILHINNAYVYDGNQLDLNQFFYFSDCTEETVSRQEEIISQIKELKKILSWETPPDIRPSRHCMNPYKCEFWEHCTSDMPEFWVMDLSGITQKKFEQLLELDIEDISEIPDEFPLSALQERIRKCVTNGQEFIATELEDELMDIEYPVHFLDFETFGSAIPRYPNTRPYQTIPFQWSNHILLENGSIQHEECLCIEDKDPREEFVETLLKTLGQKGTVFIYTTYEKGIVNQLAYQFPNFQGRLFNIVVRFKDLHALIKQHYYHPEFYGSFSLKSVLPVLVPSMNYGNLAIQEGSIASIEYLRMLDPVTPLGEKAKIKHDLLIYCGQDTLGMVKIRDELLKRLRKFS